MRIYCLTCREYIMNSSPEFVLGGPYHGAMFEGATGDYWSATMFRQVESVKGGDLFCPRCTGRFFSDTGGLLTEHGVVQAGQKSVDTTFNIVHQDGPAKGQLMYIKDSLPGRNLFSATLVDNRKVYGVMAAEDEATLEKAEEAIEEEAEIEMEDEPIPAILLGVKPDVKTATTLQDVFEACTLECPKCGKEYKDRMWFDKHVEKCEE